MPLAEHKHASWSLRPQRRTVLRHLTPPGVAASALAAFLANRLGPSFRIELHNEIRSLPEPPASRITRLAILEIGADRRGRLESLAQIRDVTCPVIALPPAASELWSGARDVPKLDDPAILAAGEPREACGAAMLEAARISSALGGRLLLAQTGDQRAFGPPQEGIGGCRVQTRRIDGEAKDFVDLLVAARDVLMVALARPDRNPKRIEFAGAPASGLLRDSRVPLLIVPSWRSGASKRSRPDPGRQLQALG